MPPHAAFIVGLGPPLPFLRNKTLSQSRPSHRTVLRAVTTTPAETSPNPFLSRDHPSSTASTHLLTLLWPPTHPSANLPTISASLSARLAALGATLAPWRTLSSTAAAEAPVTFPPTAQVDAIRNALYFHGRQAGVDVVLQESIVAREPKRLAVFDLDSTLIAQETIDELAAMVNLEKHVKNITERAMNGEIGFREALAERVRLLKGLHVDALDAVKDRVLFTPGAPELIKALRTLGCKTAVVSGGFHFLADHVRDVLGLDYSFANRLEDEQGLLTGRTIGDVVDAEYKENTLKRLAREMGLRPEQVLAVGDGSNDLLMMRSAGLGVAFNAKPNVQDKAKARLNQPSLTNVLYLLGLADDDIQDLVE